MVAGLPHRPISKTSTGMQDRKVFRTLKDIVFRVKGQTQHFWSQQKQPHLDSQGHLGAVASLTQKLGEELTW